MDVEERERLREAFRKEVERMPTKVTYESPWLSFVVNRQVIDTRKLSELQRFFDVSSGSSLYGSEEEFTVLDFGSKLWVVPNVTPRIYLMEWADQLTHTRGLFDATLGGIPAEWLKPAILGLRWGSSLPVAAVRPITSLPDWKVEGPLNPRGSSELLTVEETNRL